MSGPRALLGRTTSNLRSRMNRNAVPRILLLSVLTLAACNELEPTQPGTSDDRSAAMVVDLEASEQGALSRAIPGFGGVYLDESGTPTVYLKDVRQASRARSALA